MKADDRRARLREIRHDAIDRLHHQVHVDRHASRAARSASHTSGPIGQIRNVMVVHHVEVQEIGAGVDHRAHFVAQAREVGGQQRRRDSVFGHGFIIDSGRDSCNAYGRGQEIRHHRRGQVGLSRRSIRPGAQASTCSRTRSRSPTPAQVAAQLISRHWIITDAEHQVQEVKGSGVVGQQPLLQPGESFEYTSGTSLADRGGHDARHLPDGRRGRQDVRRRDPAVHAVDAARAPLASCPGPVSLVVPRGGFLRLGTHRPRHDGDGDEQRDQRLQQKPAHRLAHSFARSRSHAALGGALLATIAGLRHRAACAARRDAASRRTAARRPPSLPAKYRPVAWTALPGWSDDRVDEAWPAFRAGCAALVASATTQRAVAAPVQRAAKRRRPIDRDRGPRDSSKAILAHTRSWPPTDATPAWSPATTSRCLPAAAMRSARYRGAAVRRARRPADDRPDRALSGAQGQAAARAASRASASSRIGRAPTSRTGRAPVAGKALVYVEDPVEAFFLQIQGSGRVRLADGGIMRVGYADQNGHPYRSIGRILVERGELPLERASMQGIREWGRRNPREARRRCSTRIRATCSFARCRRPRPERSKRRSTARSERSACRCCASARSPSTRARFRSARRSIWPRRIRCRRGRCSG